MPAKSTARNETKKDHEKERDVRNSNITAAKSLADCIRSSLGPRGMDKMIVEPKGEVIISNDGATILQKLQVTHPCAKMLVEVSKAQDVEAGDGTTSVVVLTGALLKAVQDLLERGIHPTQISESFMDAAKRAEKIVTEISQPLDISDTETVVKAAITSLSSKIISTSSSTLAPMAVEAVRRVINQKGDVDLRNVRVVTAIGGSVDETELISNGTVFKQRASHSAGGPTRVENAKIALIQFCLSPPKTDMESTITVSDYTQMDRTFKEERQYLLQLCKKIKDAGVNVLLIQKSVLRDAVTAQSLDFLAKMKIMVVKDIERADIEFLTKTLGLLPVANIENLTADKFATAERVVQESTPDGKVIKVTGIKPPTDERLQRIFGGTATVFLRASNLLMMDEAERAFHDALCVVRSIVKKKAIIAGGSAPEVNVCMKLGKYARTEAEGINAFCMRAYADAFEVIPYTLAENAGLNPIGIVTELRNAHNQGNTNFGINVRKGAVTDMLAESVVQPLLVTTSAINLATETVVMILKIDDIILTRV